jgi:chromosome segregation ATPase
VASLEAQLQGSRTEHAATQRDLATTRDELGEARRLGPAAGKEFYFTGRAAAATYQELVDQGSSTDAQWRAYLAAKDTTILSLQQEVEAKTRELDEAIKSASLRLLSLQAHSEEIDDVKKKHAETGAANAQLKDRNHKLAQLQESSERTIAALRQQLAGGDVPTLKAELASLRDQLTKSEEALAKSKEQYEQTKDKLAEARAAVASARSSDEDRLQDLQLKKAQEALTNANAELASLRAQLAAQAPGGNDGALHHQAVAGMNAEIASLQLQLREAQTLLAASRKKAAGLTEELKDANAEIDELLEDDDNDASDELRKTVAELKEELKSLEEELQDLRTRYSESKKRAQDWELDAKARNDEIARLQADGSSGYAPRPSASSRPLRSSWASLKAKVPVRTYLPGVLPA